MCVRVCGCIRSNYFLDLFIVDVEWVRQQWEHLLGKLCSDSCGDFAAVL